MVNRTRRIGLSLGADICWPICFEELLRRLQLDVSLDGERITFEVERLSITPFDLRAPCRYDVVIDRLTHWYHPSREWIKKAIVLNDLYVFNNPWSLQAMEKQTTYCAMMRLGLPVPETWLIPPKSYEHAADLQPTLKQYARLFDLGAVGEQLGYPMFMKPYDGGAWVGVDRIDSEQDLRAAYDRSGTRVMNLQQAIEPHDRFVRCVGLGPQIRFVDYDPSAALHNRYGLDTDFLSDEDASLLRDMTLTINAFFGWDFNSCEALHSEGTWYPIDFANACPDSQVTSLHCHFPWLIMANIRWAVFAAATRRSMRLNLDWERYFEIARDEPHYRKRLSAYADIAAEAFSIREFESFCAEHLSHLDEVAYDLFGSDVARNAVQQKVEALFPAHEVEEFTELFWSRIQTARERGARA